MDAAALVDCPVPILDISAGLSVDPLSSRELDHCLKGSPSPRYSFSPSCLLLTDRRIYAPEYRPERGNLRTRGLQVSITIQRQQNTGVTTSQLRLAQHVHRLQGVCLTVRPVRSQQTLSPSSLQPPAAFTGPGAPMAFYQYGPCRAFTHV